jgi:sarcosine/dimethylglycine N-methyltransferase
VTYDDRAARVLHALQSELASKPSDRALTAAELGAIDQLHTRGYAATVDFAKAVGIDESMRVLDLGAGLGGSARYLAETYGCRVDGIDATPTMVEAANYLSSRWIGPKHLVSFGAGDATAIPFPDDTFDLVWMQHVAMNVANRAGLYSEIRRVLRHQGRFATYDVLSTKDELIYPVPWANDASISTVLTGDETRDAIEAAGLRVVAFSIDTPAALEWARATTVALPPSETPAGASMMRAALGDNFREVVGNLGKNYLEGRADVAAIIARRED